MPRTIEGIKRPVPKKTSSSDYKTRTLVKVWFRLLYKILRQSGRRLKEHLLPAVFILVVVIVVGVSLVSKDSGSIPAKYRRGLSFQLYYPSNLPGGYSVDNTSFQRQGKVLIFYINSPTGKKIGVSEEKLPNNLPNQQVNNAPIQIPGEKDFTTSIGQAHIGLSSDKYLSDIVTPQTWIVINVTGYTPSQAQTITQSFQTAD